MAGGHLRAEGLEATFDVVGPGRTIPDGIRSGEVQVAQSAIAVSFAPWARGELMPFRHFAMLNSRDGFFLAGRDAKSGDFNWKSLEGRKAIIDHFFQPLAMFRRALHLQGVNEKAVDIIDAGDVQSMERAYREGRGTGMSFQDYRGAPTDFGACVTSPANSGTLFDVDAQAIHNPGGTAAGGYDPLRGGLSPWDAGGDLRYLMGRSREQPHAVTDSAASATSLFTGRKTYNDAINVDVRGNPVEPAAAMLQRQGWAIGVVSSVPVSHATPACTYANNVSRDDYQDIARDLLGLKSISHKTDPLPGVDVLIGGGFGVDVENDQGQGRNFEPGNKYVADSTLQEIDSAVGGRYRMALRTPGQSGATVLAKAAAEAVAGKHRLFGFFGIPEGNLPFQTADGDSIPVNAPPESPDTQDALKKKYSVGSPYTPADINENPTLADMTRAALDVLGTKQRFWLMVEPGDVDWACHANNIDNCIGAIRSGDAAFRAVVEWIERTDTWDTTVVILTSDHGHLFVLTEPEAFATPD